MKLVYKKEGNAPVGSFFVKRVQEPVLDINWHFHEEYEIIYILKGQGVRMIGDSISNFHSGELVFVGSNVPHLWRSMKNVKSSDRIIVKFDDFPGGVDLFSLTDFARIKVFLHQTQTGISFGRKTKQALHKQLVQLSAAEGVDKWIYLLSILDKMTTAEDCKALSSPCRSVTNHNWEQGRLSKVISYISKNYDKDLVLENVADVACMTTQSFCRFFKRRTNKTFVQFLNEYRIGKACVLLIENKMSISEICYDLGYNSTTNFNRIFKRQYDCTPMEYRKKFTEVESQAISA